MKIRRIVTLTVLVSFIFLALSGIMLFLSPQGRVANWSGWTLLGFTKEQYGAVHTTFMLLFLTAGIWHLVLNWRPITGYLKNRSKQMRVFTPESSVAMALGLVFLLGPLLGVPPFKQFLDAGEEIKAYWEDVEGSPPWGHAEENTLQRFCRGLEDYERLENQRIVAIDCDAAVEALRAAGVEVEGTSQRLLDIAEANGTTPQALAEIIGSVARHLAPEEAVREESAGPYHKPYSGLGRLTMREYAQEYDYDLEEILTLLLARGIELDPDVRLRDEATRLDTDPEGIIQILNEG